MATQGLTREQLLQMGAKQMTPAPTGGLTKQQLLQQGATSGAPRSNPNQKSLSQRLLNLSWNEPTGAWSPATDDPSEKFGLSGVAKTSTKIATNIIPTIPHTIKGVIDFLNPIKNIKTAAQVPTEIGGLSTEAGSEVNSQLELTRQNQKLINAIRANRAAGKDTTQLIAQLKRNSGASYSDGISPLEDLAQNKLGRGQIVEDAVGGFIIPQVLKEALPKGHRSFLPDSITNLFEGDIEKARKTLVNDPTGQIAPTLLLLKGFAEEAGYGKAFDDAITKIAKPVTKTAEVVGDYAKSKITEPLGRATDATGRFAASQATGLGADTVKTILENPKEFATKRSADYTREAIGQEVHDAITSRLDELQTTGKEYTALKATGQSVELGKNIVADTLAKHGIKLSKTGELIETEESVPLKSTDVAAFEKFYKQYGDKQTLSANAFLNARRALSDMVDYDSTKSSVSRAISSDMRAQYDTIGKQQLTGLKELDAKYSPEIRLLKKVKSEYFNPDKTFKDNAISKIVNLTKTGREAGLSRLEKIVPNISQRLNILKAYEDITAASSVKVGTYTRSALGAGGIIAGIITGNPSVIGFSLLEAMIANPSIAVPLLRGYASLLGVGGKTLEGAIKSLKAINNITEAGGLTEVNKNLRGKVGLTTEAVEPKTIIKNGKEYVVVYHGGVAIDGKIVPRSGQTILKEELARYGVDYKNLSSGKKEAIDTIMKTADNKPGISVTTSKETARVYAQKAGELRSSLSQLFESVGYKAKYPFKGEGKVYEVHILKSELKEGTRLYSGSETVVNRSLKVEQEVPPSEGGQANTLKGQTDNLELLIKEARKYKSADEFVRAQTPAYHGSPVELKNFDNKQGGVFFTDNYPDATGFAGNPDTVYEGYLAFKKPLIIDAKGAKWNELDTPYGKSTQEIINKAEKKGYDGVVFKNIVDNVMDTAEVGGESTISYAFNPEDAFLNETQLTDIWNKANNKSN